MGDYFLGLCSNVRVQNSSGMGGGSFDVCREEWKLIMGV